MTAAMHAGAPAILRYTVLVTVLVAWQAYMVRRGHGGAGTWSITIAVAAILVSVGVPVLAVDGAPLSALPRPLVTVAVSLAVLVALGCLMAFQLHVDGRGAVGLRLRRPLFVLVAAGTVLLGLAFGAWAADRPIVYVNRPGLDALSAVYAVLARTTYAAVLTWVGVKSWRAARRAAPVDRLGATAATMVSVGVGLVALLTAVNAVFTVVVALGGPLLDLPAWVGPGEALVAAVCLVGGYSLPVLVGRGRAARNWLTDAGTYVVLLPLSRSLHRLFPEARLPALPVEARDLGPRRARIDFRSASRVAECLDGLVRLRVSGTAPGWSERDRDAARLLGRLAAHRPRLAGTEVDAASVGDLGAEERQDRRELRRLSLALAARRPGLLLTEGGP